jgi:hypothetical protein
MSTNLQSQIASPRGLSGEGWAAIAGAVGSAFLLARKLLGSKPGKPELVSRAEFCAEMLASRQRMHEDHLALLEKLDANHRELLAALERLGTRINALDTGLARVDERTR